MRRRGGRGSREIELPADAHEGAEQIALRRAGARCGKIELSPDAHESSQQAALRRAGAGTSARQGLGLSADAHQGAEQATLRLACQGASAGREAGDLRLRQPSGRAGAGAVVLLRRRGGGEALVLLRGARARARSAGARAVGPRARDDAVVLLRRRGACARGAGPRAKSRTASVCRAMAADNKAPVINAEKTRPAAKVAAAVNAARQARGDRPRYVKARDAVDHALAELLQQDSLQLDGEHALVHHYTQILRAADEEDEHRTLRLESDANGLPRHQSIDAQTALQAIASGRRAEFRTSDIRQMYTGVPALRRR